MNQQPNKIKEFVEITLELAPEQIDLVSDFIIENICNGLVLEDEEGSIKTNLKFYFPVQDREKHIKSLTDYFSNHDDSSYRNIKINEKLIQNIAWENEYKKSIKPVWIDDIVVRPTWDEAKYDARFEIILEPKMAFGTGTHETTRSCIHIIRKKFKSEMSFLDLGCGSGILSILADQMGASYIKAVDYDLLAVENSIENFQINSVKTKHDIIHGSIEKCENDKPYHFVCANIIRSTILEMLPELNRLTASKGILVLSGLLAQDEPEVRKTLEGISLTNIEKYSDNEWRTLIIAKE